MTVPNLAEYMASLVPAGVAWMQGNKLPFVAHCARFGVAFPEVEITQHATVCKVITSNTRFPMWARVEAKRWLVNNNLSSHDDGDVTV